MVPPLVKVAAAGRLALGSMAKKATPVLTAAFSTSSEPPPPAELKNSTQLSVGERKFPKMPSLTLPTFVRGPVMGLSSGDILPIWP